MLDEQEVERRFHLTASKLRVAQRLGLAESSIGVRHDGRYVRAWDLVQIARVYLANSITSYTVIPFQAACDVLLEIEKVGGVIVGASMTPGAAPPSAKSMLHLYDRCVVAFEFDHGEVPIGRLESREDGRTTFIAEVMAIPHPWLTKSSFDGLEARGRFLQLAQSA